MSLWAGNTVTSDTGWNHLETLVDIGNRMAGSEGERRAADETRDVLANVGGRDARLEEFPIKGWQRGSSAIDTDETTEASIALPRSPAGNVTGELVDVGHGLPEDFDDDLSGKVVMAASNVPDWYERFIHRNEKYYYAVAAGAEAFVFRNHVEGCLAPTGSIGSRDAPIGDIPAVGVSKEVGARLKRRWTGTNVTVEVEVDIQEATSQNVHADLGPDTEEHLLVTSHVDAHDIAEGAWDNGSGTAMVVEIARALAEREDDLDTRVHLLVFGAEEVGLLGSEYDSERRDHDTIKGVVNNDGVVRGRTLKFYTHGFEELRELAEAIADDIRHPVSTTPRLGPHSDHWPYVKWGVPGYHVWSETGEEGRGWGHTSADTLDKVDIRNLREQALFLTELVVRLADDDVHVAPREPEDIAEQLEEEDLAEGMKVAGEWPY